MNNCIKSKDKKAWCPGCGNHKLLEALEKALNDLGKEPYNTVIVSGIGQAAKLPHYINTNGFNGLHGRAVPPAVGIKIANPDLSVIINSGDGDSYGEGGNHFIHNIRRNVDITHFIHDNQIYGLTKGQASPTTSEGHVTGIQNDGVINQPFNPMALSITLGATFVARASVTNFDHLVKIMKEAINHKGYSVVDIFQPCVVFNKINTYAWYNEKTYELDDDYDYTNKMEAYKKSLEFEDKIPIGIIYKEKKDTYLDRLNYIDKSVPLVDQSTDLNDCKDILKDFY